MGDSKANIDNKKENDDVTIDPVICYNLSYFKDLMKEYRKLDDNIMLRLNSTDTHSQAACGAFFQQLAKAYTKREKVITFCLKIMDEELTQKQKKYEDDPFDRNLKNEMFVTESKRRMITNEVTVEDIVRERSINLFKNKCRIFRIPPDFREFISKQ